MDSKGEPDLALMSFQLLVTKLTLSRSNKGKVREISNGWFNVSSAETHQKTQDVFNISGLPIFL